jgi:hypothetical protein
LPCQQGGGQIGVAATVLTPSSHLSWSNGPAALYLAGIIGARLCEAAGCLLQLTIFALVPLMALALVVGILLF